MKDMISCNEKGEERERERGREREREGEGGREREMRVTRKEMMTWICKLESIREVRHNSPNPRLHPPLLLHLMYL